MSADAMDENDMMGVRGPKQGCFVDIEKVRCVGVHEASVCVLVCRNTKLCIFSETGFPCVFVSKADSPVLLLRGAFAARLRSFDSCGGRLISRTDAPKWLQLY